VHKKVALRHPSLRIEKPQPWEWPRLSQFRPRIGVLIELNSLRGGLPRCLSSRRRLWGMRRQLDTIAAQCFGAIERLICRDQQRREIKTRIVRDCHANADCRGKRLRCDRVVGDFERGAYPVCEHEGILTPYIRQQARELLTSDAAKQVGRPEQRSRHLTKCGKHFVTDMVPEFVVDALEAIEIECKKRGRLAREACSGHHPFGSLQKATPVCNAGQWVD